jgi:hypothetical protein
MGPPPQPPATEAFQVSPSHRPHRPPPVGPPPFVYSASYDAPFSLASHRVQLGTRLDDNTSHVMMEANSRSIIAGQDFPPPRGRKGRPSGHVMTLMQGHSFSVYISADNTHTHTLRFMLNLTHSTAYSARHPFLRPPPLPRTLRGIRQSDINFDKTEGSRWAMSESTNATEGVEKGVGRTLFRFRHRTASTNEYWVAGKGCHF